MQIIKKYIYIFLSHLFVHVYSTEIERIIENNIIIKRVVAEF